MRGTGLVKIPGPLTDVRLVYTSPSRRDECVRFLMKPLEIDDLTDTLDSDAIVVNFIVGIDVSLETLTRLRARYEGFLAADIHNLIIHFDEQGKIHYRGLPDWKDWLANLNLVQMNDIECSHVLDRRFSGEIAEFQEAVEEMASVMNPRNDPSAPRMAVITLAERGSVMAYAEDGAIRSAWQPARTIENLVDPTGCGDSFMAGFILNFLKTRNPLLANAAANIVAGAVCEGSGLISLSHVRNAAELVPKYYPDFKS